MSYYTSPFHLLCKTLTWVSAHVESWPLPGLRHAQFQTSQLVLCSNPGVGNLRPVCQIRSGWTIWYGLHHNFLYLIGVRNCIKTKLLE